MGIAVQAWHIVLLSSECLRFTIHGLLDSMQPLRKKGAHFFNSTPQEFIRPFLLFHLFLLTENFVSTGFWINFPDVLYRSCLPTVGYSINRQNNFF
jgi:hypothetical protein